jgi:hypothetical protein
LITSQGCIENNLTSGLPNGANAETWKNGSIGKSQNCWG